MTETMECKDSITDAADIISQVMGDFDDMKAAMEAAKELLAEDAWTGTANEKCVLLHGPMRRYCGNIGRLASQLREEITSLGENAQEFHENSEAVLAIQRT